MSIFVLTSPRATAEPFSYLHHTLKQIHGEGLAAHVVVDGLEQLAFEDFASDLADLGDFTSYRFERPAGSFKGGNKLPYFHLLELALEAGGDVVALEDDLELCENAMLRMITFPVPKDVAWVQFFSAWTFRDEKIAGIASSERAPWRPHPGLWRVPSPLQGCQAIKYPHRTLEQLVDWKRRDPEWGKYNESDVALGLAQERLSLRNACHSPDLVQHVGDSSVVSHGMMDEAGVEGADRAAADDSLVGRRSVTYPGRSFDAMRLFARHGVYR